MHAGHSINLKEAYSCVNDSILVLHLGSMLEEELRLEGPTEKVYPEHLGLRGAFNLVYDVKPRLAIISEIGEELQDSICSLADNLKAVFSDSIILPADVGLRLDLSKLGDPIGVLCQECKRIVNIKNISYLYDPERQSVRYICHECKPC